MLFGSPRKPTALVAPILVAAWLACSASGQVRREQPDADFAALDPYAPTPPFLQIAADGQPLPENRGAAGLSEKLKQLGTWGSLLMITAHPDDEDGGMLTAESRGLGVRTGLFTLTRGEGGQNAISGADYDALGLIRTNELLRADAFYGLSAQYWGTVADYGFSKTMEEALAQWGYDRVLYDAVRTVRLFRPLVVTSVFNGGITDGHGHHQVAGLLAQRVYTAAADPTVFPDQIAAGLRPWKPLAVFARLPFFSISSKGMYDYATGKYAPARFRNYITNTWIEGAPSTDVTIEAGAFDPALGETYFQIARRGLGEQRTQHAGPVVPLGGPAGTAYHRYSPALPGSSTVASAAKAGFFTGIDTSLPGMAMLAHRPAPFLRPGLERIADAVTSATRAYSAASPATIAPMLAQAFHATEALMEQVRTSELSADDQYNLLHELMWKREQLNSALTAALGLHITALVLPEEPGNDARGALSLTPEDSLVSAATPGSSVPIRVHISTGSSGAQLVAVTLATPRGEDWTVRQTVAPQLHQSTPAQNTTDAVFSVALPAAAQPTRPYFSRASIEQAFYDLSAPQWRNRSFAPYPLIAKAGFTYKGVPLELTRVVQSVHRELGLGALFQPLTVAPALSVTLDARAGIVPLPAEHTASAPPPSYPLTVHLRATEHNEETGMLHLELPAGWHIEPESIPFHLRGGEESSVAFAVHPAGTLAAKPYTLRAVAQTSSSTAGAARIGTAGREDYTDGYIEAGYAGLDPYPLFRSATGSLRGVDVKVAPGLTVGYIMGTGDALPEAIAELGMQPHILSTAELADGDLSRYTTLVLGIRAYSARTDLTAATPRLLEYVRNGGTLVVQYQSSGSYGDSVAPFPVSLGANPEKVVDEHAPVTLLAPENPLLNYPNRITAADFNSWVEERGHSFLSSWAPEYTALTETHDPGQDPQRGGLLLAHYGRGIYVYVAYALYRQTPEAVPGAFRLLANLLSAGKQR